MQRRTCSTLRSSRTMWGNFLVPDMYNSYVGVGSLQLIYNTVTYLGAPHSVSDAANCKNVPFLQNYLP